jgi:hypothetical protein
VIPKPQKVITGKNNSLALFNDVSSDNIYCVNYRMINKAGAVGGMKIDSGNTRTWVNFLQVPLCPPEIPHDLN